MGIFEIGFVVVTLVMALFGLAATGFWIWMLIDCVTNEPSEGNNKIIWGSDYHVYARLGRLDLFLCPPARANP